MDHYEWIDVSPIEKLGDFPAIAMLFGLGGCLCGIFSGWKIYHFVTWLHAWTRRDPGSTANPLRLEQRLSEAETEVEGRAPVFFCMASMASISILQMLHRKYREGD